MSEDINPNSFTQKDLMVHLLHTAQHSVTREEMANQFAQSEKVTKERFDHVDRRFEQIEKRFEQVDKRFEQVDKRFEQVDKRFEQVDKRFDELKLEIKEQGKKHDRLSWAIFTGMLAIFFKDVIMGIVGQI